MLRDHKNEELQEQNLIRIRDRLLYIEKECFEKNEDGVFWMGNQITLVDLHYAPFFERFSAYEHLFDAKWPDECINIRSWWEAMQERQSYLETFLPTESHIATYSEMMQRIAS